LRNDPLLRYPNVKPSTDYGNFEVFFRLAHRNHIPPYPGRSDELPAAAGQGRKAGGTPKNSGD
jgi:hypothetical protein